MSRELTPEGSPGSSLTGFWLGLVRGCRARGEQRPGCSLLSLPKGAALPGLRPLTGPSRCLVALLMTPPPGCREMGFTLVPEGIKGSSSFLHFLFPRAHLLKFSLHVFGYFNLIFRVKFPLWANLMDYSPSTVMNQPRTVEVLCGE